jgi:hypothetical protein
VLDRIFEGMEQRFVPAKASDVDADILFEEAQGPQLFMAGKLKVSGDLMFSTRIMSFFDQPKA